MRYDAFISYRHSELDMFVAKKIHKGLETLKVPRSVKKISDKSKITRVFRDQEELPIGSDLTNNIEIALQESEFLIVICSPRTVQSEWVHKEINTFIKMHGREHILAVLIEGEPDESIPAQLLTDEQGNHVEPLAADVRGKDKREVNRKLKTEVMRLAAPLLHCSYDDLKQRHRERRLRKIIALTSLVTVLAIAFGAYSVYKTSLIQKNFLEKQKNQSRYLADTSLRLFEEGDRQTAVLVALEALPTKEHDRPYVPQAQYALSKAVRSYDIGNDMEMDRMLIHEFNVDLLNYSLDGSKIVSTDGGGNTYLWDVETGKLLTKIEPGVDKYAMILDPKDARVIEDNILICTDEDLTMYDQNGAVIWSKEIDCLYCQFNMDQTMIACTQNDKVSFYDTKSGDLIADIENTIEDSFVKNMAFFENDKKFAIAHLVSILDREEKETTSVSVYDFETKELISFEVKASYINNLTFASDGNVVVASQVINYSVNTDSKKNVYVQKFDSYTGEVIWEYTCELVDSLYNSADTCLKARSYQSADDVTHEEVIMVIDNYAFTWDSGSGELLSSVQTGNGINTLLIRGDSSYGFLGESNGNVDIVNMTTGEIFSANTIETGTNLKAFILSNGVLGIKRYTSPEIVLMKYHQGKGIKEIGIYANSISTAKFSADETHYMISHPGDTYDDYFFNFYNTSDDSLINTLQINDTSLIAYEAFLDENTYLVITCKGKIYYYDVINGLLTEGCKLEFESYSGQCHVTSDKKRALFYTDHEYFIVDIDKKEIIYSGKTEKEDKIYTAVITEDGKTIYTMLDDSRINAINTQDNSVKALVSESSPMVKMGNEIYSVALSIDGRYLATCTKINRLLIYDLVEEKVVDEIPFTNAYDKYIGFTHDSRKVILQGNDRYIRIYDIDSRSIIFVSTDQYRSILNIMYDEENKRLSLTNSTGITILSSIDYECIDEIRNGLVYMPKSNVVLSKLTKTCYRFPFKSLEMLIEEAYEQFGDAKLTDLQRRQYNVD